MFLQRMQPTEPIWIHMEMEQNEGRRSTNLQPDPSNVCHR